MKRNRIRILLADNDQEFLNTREEILEAQGYEVIPASGVEQAERLLENNRVDLALLDLRLRDDKDEEDISGLALMRRMDPSIPKILVTGFPSVEIARRALKRDLDNGPAAVDMLSKDEGVGALLRTVESVVGRDVALAKRKRMRKRIAVAFVAGGVVLAGLGVYWMQLGLKGGGVTVLAGVAVEMIAALLVKATMLK